MWPASRLWVLERFWSVTEEWLQRQQQQTSPASYSDTGSHLARLLPLATQATLVPSRAPVPLSSLSHASRPSPSHALPFPGLG